MHHFSIWLRASAPWLLAAAAFALAYFSPIEEVHSDPAIALLATQSLLDNHTLSLDAYADDPACAYDLEQDYRIRHRGESMTYYSHGVSLLSLPAVWLANRFGFHMLDQSDEFALQNLLSALCCALLGILFYRICGTFLGPMESLAVAAVSLFGSSLVSTLATGLWNVGFQAVLLALGLLHLVRANHQGLRPNVGYLALLAGLAFICRPTAAFAILAAPLALVPSDWLKKRNVWLPLALGLTTLTAVLIALDLAGWIPRYYSPLKLTPQAYVWTGLPGILVSPSRGLLVFSPFLTLVAAVCLWHLKALAGRRLFQLAAVWTGLHLLAVAIKGAWWGGHSYGPRLLAEVTVPAILATCLAWRLLQQRAGPRTRILLATAYLACGLAAVYIHSYQGLFNHHTRRWNWMPNVDVDPLQLVFDWRYPQFLASDSALERRRFELARRDLGVYTLGREVTDADDADLGALFRDWYPSEPGWRWSRGTSPEILLNLGEFPNNAHTEGTIYLLHLRAGSLGHQEIGLRVNGTDVGRIELDGSVRERAFAFEHDLLKPGQENSLQFDLPGATATATDPRVMALALHAFKLEPRVDSPVISPGDEAFFISGFSAAEGAWRWTEDHRAVIDIPVGDTAVFDTLEITGSALHDQSVALRLNGVELGELSFAGGFDAVTTRRLTFDPDLLRPFRMNRIELGVAASAPHRRRRPSPGHRLPGVSRYDRRQRRLDSSDSGPSRVTWHWRRPDSR